MIVSPGLYDNAGLTYVDNSFSLADISATPNLRFLFDGGSVPNRGRHLRNPARRNIPSTKQVAIRTIYLCGLDLKLTPKRATALETTVEKP